METGELCDDLGHWLYFILYAKDSINIFEQIEFQRKVCKASNIYEGVFSKESPTNTELTKEQLSEVESLLTKIHTAESKEKYPAIVSVY